MSVNLNFLLKQLGKGLIFLSSLYFNTLGVFGEVETFVLGDLVLKKQKNAFFQEIVFNKSVGSGVIIFNLKQEPLNLKSFTHLAVGLKNNSKGNLDVRLFATSENENSHRYTKGRFLVGPFESDEMRVLLIRNYFDASHPWSKAFERVRGLPGGHFSNWRYLDVGNIRKLKLEISWKGVAAGMGGFLLKGPYGSGEYTTHKLSPSELPRPLVDDFGQLVIGDWEGRVNNITELAQDGVRDGTLFIGHPVMPGFTQYGGWKSGPRFEDTGHFYTKKFKGKWWFIDPEGYLFWSLGVTGVGGGAVTRVSGREHLFPDSLNRDYLRKENFVSNQKSFTGYDFLLSNLHHKYGADWEVANQQVTLGRMRAWGLNTIGAWSVDSVLGKGLVPYTLIIHPKLQGLGKLKKIPDPFSHEFRESLRAKLIELADLYKGDPWNLGVFINNELHWGKGSRLASEVIDLKLSVPAKQSMVDFYQKRYGVVKKLNEAWGSKFKSFETIRSLSDTEATKAYYKDLIAYCDYHADAYFSLCAEMLDKYMPEHLYLGCRFHGDIYNGGNESVQNVASRHVDVMSYNIYKTSIHGIETHQEVDRPNIIGEFHFGTGSHGVWGYGLVACDTLEDQAELYEIYVKEAQQHPDFIGAHWFKWSDHPTTGRYDGENYRIGFVSIVDRDYKPLTGAIKQRASSMYRVRLGME